MWLMVGLQYLKHCYGLSDEAVVSGWVESPYWQYVCGVQHVPPIDPGSPYDGHTLKTALEQVRRVTGSRIDEAFVDKGYRGYGETVTTVYISGQKRGITTQRLKRSLERRQAIEPVIGHLKADGLLGRNHLKGAQGDQINVLLSCAGHNLRLILNRLRLFWLEATMRLLA